MDLGKAAGLSKGQGLGKVSFRLPGNPTMISVVMATSGTAARILSMSSLKRAVS